MLLVHKNDIQIVLAEFVDTHLLPKASGWYKLGLGAVSFLITQRLNQLIDNPTNEGMLKTIGLMNDECQIDMDYAKAMALHSIKQNGGKTPPVGGYLIFDESDIENLYKTAHKIYGGLPNEPK